MNYEGIVNELKTSDLIAVFNNYSTTPVKKFADYSTAKKRVFKILDELQPDASDMLEVEGLSDDGKDVVRSHDSKPLIVTKAPKLKEEKDEPKKPRAKGDTGNRNKGKILTKITDKSLRDKSRRKDTYDKIVDGMSYEDFRNKNGNAADLSILIRNGNVKAE